MRVGLFPQSESVNTLVDLGLTQLQASIYLALVELQEATIKSVAKASNVARQNIYQIMETLQELGLVEKNLGIPVKFRAIPFEKAVEMLFKKRTEEYQKLEMQTKRILDSSDRTKKQEKSCSESIKFVTMLQAGAHKIRSDHEIDNAVRGIDTILKEGQRFTNRDFPREMRDALGRGLTVRIITSKPINAKQTRSSTPVRNKKGILEIRYASEPLPAMFALIDEKEVFFAVEPVSNPFSRPHIWTNNPSLVAVTHSYFEQLWKSLEKKPKENRTEILKTSNPRPHLHADFSPING